MRRIGRYFVLKKLGEGGMGVVYEAEDARLERRVALKTIHANLVDETTRRRMWREARAASAVSHPNICQIFEFGESDGELFLAMELLEGEALSDRLARGPLPPAEALEVGIAIAAALDALHRTGVVHRDLKPSNVFLTPHGPKLLDFGLALPVGGVDAEERLTRTGVFVGTPGFMAPESWSGDEVGPRADLFALGALMIEMISGQPAFQGASPMELLHAVLQEPAPTLTGGPAIEAADRAIQAALAKRPEDRPSDAAEFGGELERALALVDGNESPGALRLRRMLVIPFRLLVRDADLDFLPMGLADALTTSLGSIEGMVLKSSHVGEKYASGEFDPERIATETGVQHALTGTVQRAGDRLRVTAQLMSVPDGAVVWSETLEASVGDLFTLQDELSRHISESFTRGVVSPRRTPVASEKPASPKAYEFFLRANQMGYNFAKLGDARRLYHSAVEEDPAFAPAWARLGRVSRVMAKYGHGDGLALLDESEKAFRRSLELSPDLALAHNLFAYYEIEELGRSHDAMVRLLGQTRRTPDNPELFSGLVVACRFCGLLDASVEADRHARRLDPGIPTSIAYTHWMRGDYAAAIGSDDEDLSWNHFHALPLLGRADEAVAKCRELEQRSPHRIERAMFTSTRAAIEGDRKACVAATRRVFGSTFHDPEGLYFESRNLVHVGEGERGLFRLNEIVARGFHCWQALETDPWLEPVRGTAEFAALLAAARAGSEKAARTYEKAGGTILLGPVG